MKTPFRFATLVYALFFTSTIWTLAQGPLAPSSAPTPTMKTLDQVEARTPIAGGNTPVTISSSGSYYLTGNLNVLSGTAITISNSDVTLDLNGFFVQSSATGILVGSVSNTNITIRNGTVRFCGALGINAPGNARVRVHNVRASNNSSGGIAVDINGEVVDCVAQSNGGIGIKGTDNCLIRDCQVIGTTGTDGINVGKQCAILNCVVSSNAGRGIVTGARSVLQNCTANSNQDTGIDVTSGCSLANCVAADNSGAAGISASGQATMINCSATGNTAAAGLLAGTGSSLTNCSAEANTSSASISAGMNVGVGSTISHCSANFNASTAGTLTESTGGGIFINQGSTVTDCTSGFNQGDGIQVNTHCRVFNNTCSDNGNNGGVGAGIHTKGLDNVIDNNAVISGKRGLLVDSTGSLIIRNKATDNSVANYDIAANNKVGTIVTIPNSALINGSTGGAGAGTTDPWANFSF